MGDQSNEDVDYGLVVAAGCFVGLGGLYVMGLELGQIFAETVLDL